MTGRVVPASLSLVLSGFFAVLSSAQDCSPDCGFELRVELPYQAEGDDPIVHEVDFSAVVTPPYQCQTLRVWLPLPQTDAAQEISNSRLNTFPLKVQPQIGVEPIYGNKFAYFEFHEPRGAQIMRHRFTAEVRNLNWSIDFNDVLLPEYWPPSFGPYLQSQSIADDRAFSKLLSQIAPHDPGSPANLLGVMNWIDANLRYDHVNASLGADANHAFQQRSGHCSDYHGLCATMGRKLGFPTRVTYGLALYPKNSPSHCKVEAFLPPYGWVSFDLSETQKLVEQIAADSSLSPSQKKTLAKVARRRLHDGFRENSWLLLTKGTDYELAPKATRPVSIVRTIYAEADGEPLPEPDPANVNQRAFGWMTVHKYSSDKPFELPFKDVSTLDTSTTNR